VMRKLGVPYPEGYEERAVSDMYMQADEITENLAKSGIQVKNDSEIIALIAYMQRLGTDINPEGKVAKPYHIEPTK
jgi:cytochrome c oxidase cbb3-type subunit I/II